MTDERGNDEHRDDRRQDDDSTREHPMDQQRRLGDRYEVGGLLGRGGMAEVHAGRDLRLGRDVAVKSLRVDLARDKTFQARFRREAQSAASLNHPNVVAVYDTGEQAGPDTGGVSVPFIVMERVDGTTLRDLMADDRRLLPERALEITSSVLDALDYSHGRGIVHRDIKPANVMLTRTGEVKVMDFGIARAIADTQSTMTQTGATLGTAQYLSPEQAQGGTVDQRSDIYSTGCMLYELLTGRPPFTGESPVSVAYQHVRENPLPPSQVDADVPADVDPIVMKALAKNPENRYQSAAEMREDIARFLAGRPVAATPLDDETRAFTTATAVTDVTPPERSQTARRIGLVVLGLLVAVALIAGIVALLSGDGAKQVTVRNLVGLTEQQARNQLEGQGLSVGELDREASDVEEGRVIRQDPEYPGTVDEGGTVDIVISRGPDKVDVPTLVDLPLESAREALVESGLVLGRIRDRDSAAPENTVVDSRPKQGTSVEKGSTVDLFVSSGNVEVPNVVDMTEDEAVATLENAGFRVTRSRDISDEVDEGRVFRQTPAAGERLRDGATVVIVIAVAPPEPTTAEPTPSDTVTTEPPPDDGDGDTDEE